MKPIVVISFKGDNQFHVELVCEEGKQDFGARFSLEYAFDLATETAKDYGADIVVKWSAINAE